MADSDDRVLVVLMDGSRAGVVEMDRAGQLSLTYDDAWRETRSATPLSLSMPLAQHAHGHATVSAFLWGLLPDNERVLDRWARTYQVSPRNPFALLRHVGEDCAGAAQFVRQDRVEAMLAGDGDVDWLDTEQVANRLHTLRQDPTAWHVNDRGQFSLAGAQAKTALYFDQASGRWGEPHGAVPTTHILKPAISGLDDHDLNEHLCLCAARLIGLPAAASHIGTFGNQRAIVVERYDRRLVRGGIVTRIHQEDMCQALGIPPTSKYQNDHGPAPEQIVGVLRRNVFPVKLAAEAVNRFVDALAFNWLVGGTDAHAKNYSILLRGPEVRLAPLYDVASALPYDSMYAPKLKMAMKIGGRYGVETINGRHWRRFAEDNGLDPDSTIARIDHLAEAAPEAFATAADEAVKELDSQLPARLVERIASRAAHCRTALQS